MHIGTHHHLELGSGYVIPCGCACNCQKENFGEWLSLDPIGIVVISLLTLKWRYGGDGVGRGSNCSYDAGNGTTDLQKTIAPVSEATQKISQATRQQCFQLSKIWVSPLQPPQGEIFSGSGLFIKAQIYFYVHFFKITFLSELSVWVCTFSKCFQGRQPLLCGRRSLLFYVFRLRLLLSLALDTTSLDSCFMNEATIEILCEIWMQCNMFTF